MTGRIDKWQLSLLPVIDTHHVNPYIENLTACAIYLHVPPILWYGGTDDGNLKRSIELMQSISLAACKRIFPSVVGSRSGNMNRWDNRRACHLHWEPKYHARNITRTTGPIWAIKCDSRRASVRVSLLTRPMAGLAHFCGVELLEPAIFRQAMCNARKYLRQHCCAHKLPVTAILPHSNALLVQMVHEWCTVRGHQVRQHRILIDTVCKGGVQRTTLTRWVCTKITARVVYSLSAFIGVLCTYSVHSQCTRRYTVNLQSTL